jgi:hypothetical protein
MSTGRAWEGARGEEGRRERAMPGVRGPCLGGGEGRGAEAGLVLGLALLHSWTLSRCVASTRFNLKK